MLRPHPLDGVLGVVATNVRRQQPDVRVFEIGRTYERAAGGDTGTIEPRWAAIALTGARREAGWHGDGGVADVYDAKGSPSTCWPRFGLAVADPRGGRLGGLRARQPRQSGHRRPARSSPSSARWRPAPRARFGIDAPVFAAALPLDRLPPLPVAPRYQPLPRFPSVQRDMAFVDRRFRGGGGGGAGGHRPRRRGRCCGRSPCSTCSACPRAGAAWLGA